MERQKICKRYVSNLLLSLLAYITVVIYSPNVELMRIYFSIYIIFVYVLVMPKELLNPKNVVFGFYFMWYVIAPAFANRYKFILEKHNVESAYFMFATTYLVIMLTLDFCSKKERKVKVYYIKEKLKLLEYEKLGLLILYFFALFMYIQRTGGLGRWLTNANDAFFDRGGSGIFYLIFEYSLHLLLFFAGKKRGLLRKIPYLILCLVTMFFCGSKSIAVMFAFMLFSDWIMELNLWSKESIVVVLCGLGVFVFGMFVRNGQYMGSISAIISTCLNYFDTFDEFLLLLSDFKPSFAKTIAMPLNWILLKLGVSVGIPYHDTSIWLTTIYYPESWENGGTHQWPLEAYLYINFYYIFGLIFVVIYFLIISYIYQKAKEEKGVWRFIYLCEVMRIISHLRGGLFNYWYIYMIPFYLILIMWEKARYGYIGKEIKYNG